MDTMTHILFGAATAQLGFRQRLGRGATWAAAAAAMAPDLDMLAGRAMSAVAAHAHAAEHMMGHRGLTHSLLMAPAFALPIAGAWWGLRRFLRRKSPASAPDPPSVAAPAPFRFLYVCVLAAGLTHPLLDWCTSYGTELLAPLTDARFALNFLPIIDIFFTSVLVLGLLACFLVRKIARGGAGRAALALGWVGFLLSAGYVAAGGVLHHRAVEEARRLAGEAPIRRVEAYPALGSVFLWRTVVETDEVWRVVAIAPLSRPRRPYQAEVAAKESSVWIDRARQLERVRGYEWFAMGWVRAERQDAGDIHLVDFHDMRYGVSTESVDSLWPLRVTFDKSGNLAGIEDLLPRLRGGLAGLLREAWQECRFRLRELWFCVTGLHDWENGPTP